MNQNKLTINLIFDVVVNIEKYFTIQFSKNIWEKCSLKTRYIAFDLLIKAMTILNETSLLILVISLFYSIKRQVYSVERR